MMFLLVEKEGLIKGDFEKDHDQRVHAGKYTVRYLEGDLL